MGRPELLAAYRTSCLRHETMGQATLLNLLLRSYLAYNLYEQALKLVQKTNFPESRPGAQYARYLFYIGQIKAVQLEYSDSHSKLMQAIRKAPQGATVALGFKLSAQKLAIIVELLMGGVPDRSTFTQKESKEALRPYYAITQAVRSGDLNAFKEAMQGHEAQFKKDKTLTLINRLRYNVIKTGLRSINVFTAVYLCKISAQNSGSRHLRTLQAQWQRQLWTVLSMQPSIMISSVSSPSRGTICIVHANRRRHCTNELRSACRCTTIQ